MRPTSHVRTRTAALTVALTLALTGCAAELPQPVPAAAPAVPPPATTIEQTDQILQDIGAVLAAGDAASSAAELAPRVSGPALTLRTAEYAIAAATAATAGAQPITPLPVAPQAVVVPSTTEWPRTQMVVTVQPDDLTSPRLLVLRQESPRAAYTLWGWARLLPGVQMPPTATPEVGSAPLPADAQGLVATPTDVVAQYADVLTNGAASAFAASFATPDPFLAQIERIRTDYLAATQGSGTFTLTAAPVAGEVFSLATADGGALVVAGLTIASSLRVSGASLPIPVEFAAVSGGTIPPGAVLRNNLDLASTDVVAFYVPPAGAAAPVRVLAGEHTFTSASGS